MFRSLGVLGVVTNIYTRVKAAGPRPAAGRLPFDAPGARWLPAPPAAQRHQRQKRPGEAVPGLPTQTGFALAGRAASGMARSTRQASTWEGADGAIPRWPLRLYSIRIATIRSPGLIATSSGRSLIIVLKISVPIVIASRLAFSTSSRLTFAPWTTLLRSP